jgi:hypothetical protein
MLLSALSAPGDVDADVLLWPQLFPGGGMDSAADRARLVAALQALPPGSAPALAYQRALRKLVDATAHAKGGLPLEVLLGCVATAARRTPAPLPTTRPPTHPHHARRAHPPSLRRPISSRTSASAGAPPSHQQTRPRRSHHPPGRRPRRL